MWGYQPFVIQSLIVFTGGIAMKFKIKLETEIGWDETRSHEISTPQ